MSLPRAGPVGFGLLGQRQIGGGVPQVGRCCHAGGQESLAADEARQRHGQVHAGDRNSNACCGPPSRRWRAAG
jgi:hypothetical protein